MDIDAFAPRLSFFWGIGMNFYMVSQSFLSHNSFQPNRQREGPGLRYLWRRTDMNISSSGCSWHKSQMLLFDIRKLPNCERPEDFGRTWWRSISTRRSQNRWHLDATVRHLGGPWQNKYAWAFLTFPFLWFRQSINEINSVRFSAHAVKMPAGWIPENPRDILRVFTDTTKHMNNSFCAAHHYTFVAHSKKTFCCRIHTTTSWGQR